MLGSNYFVIAAYTKNTKFGYWYSSNRAIQIHQSLYFMSYGESIKPIKKTCQELRQIKHYNMIGIMKPVHLIFRRSGWH